MAVGCRIVLVAVLLLIGSVARGTEHAVAHPSEAIGDRRSPEVRSDQADITASCYPLTRPKTRRRAAGKGGPPCSSNPTVRLTVDPTACEGVPVRVSWQASEANARVHIQGVACDLSASGSMTVTARQDMTLRAIATTCGIGPEAAATVEIEPGPEITSFAAEHDMLVPFGITTLQFTYEHATSWSIEGAEAFQDDPLSGASPFGGSARVYFAAVPAEPVLTVLGRCGAAIVPLSIPRCTGEAPELDIAQTDGRAALGQQQGWTFNASPSVTTWWLETDNGRFVPSSGVRSGNGEFEVIYEPARAGEASFTLYDDSACGIDGVGGGTQTVWNCAQPIIQSFTAGATTLAVGQSTYVSYITQERHGEVGNVPSSLGNALGGPVHSPFPETRHTYTATHAGADTVTLTVQTPCGPSNASLQITVH